MQYVAKLSDAISKAQNGATITLLRDATEDVTIAAGKTLVINGDGNTLWGAITCTVDATDGNKTTDLTLNNLKMDGNNAKAQAITSQNQNSSTVSGLNLTMNSCTVQNYTNKGIYLTNAVSLNIDGCTFANNATGEMNKPNTKGDYTIDLNLCSVKTGDLSITNTTFEGTCGDKAVIKVAARGGESDQWDGSDISGSSAASVDSLTITGCTFNDSNPAAAANVNIGTDNKKNSGGLKEGEAAFVANTTGKFDVTISGNLTPVVVNPAYLTYKASDGKYYLATGNGKESVENITVPTGYTYTKKANDNTTSGTVTAPSTPGGGGGTTAPSYDIAVAQPADGTIAVEPTSAKEGDEVTVTVTPDEGFELSELTVTDEDGNPLKLTANVDGTYSFEMPAGKVSVSATFVCDGGALCPSHGFTDVDQDQWYHAAIDWAVTEGVMHGIGGTTLFDPDGDLTREQAATVMWNGWAQGDLAAPAVALTDVDQAQWYAPYVNWAVKAAVMQGYGGTDRFGVGDALTREQFAMVIANATEANLSGADTSVLEGFNDPESVSDWATPVMAWAVESGVINGVALNDGTFDLQGSREVTRAEMAMMVMNAVEEGILEL